MIQAKYKSIKDSLQRIRLPEGYKTDTALRGIGRQHIQQARVINASSDYAETLMKFILTLQEQAPLTAEDIDTCMTIVSAHIKYLQAEKGVCYVNAKFGDNVGRAVTIPLFRDTDTYHDTRAMIPQYRDT